jgi:hypothetical protein
MIPDDNIQKSAASTDKYLDSDITVSTVTAVLEPEVQRQSDSWIPRSLTPIVDASSSLNGWKGDFLWSADCFEELNAGALDGSGTRTSADPFAESSLVGWAAEYLEL